MTTGASLWHRTVLRSKSVFAGLHLGSMQAKRQSPSPPAHCSRFYTPARPGIALVPLHPLPAPHSNLSPQSAFRGSANEPTHDTATPWGQKLSHTTDRIYINKIDKHKDIYIYIIYIYICNIQIVHGLTPTTTSNFLRTPLRILFLRAPTIPKMFSKRSEDVLRWLFARLPFKIAMTFWIRSNFNTCCYEDALHILSSDLARASAQFRSPSTMCMAISDLAGLG